jgi:hypothetical protein
MSAMGGKLMHWLERGFTALWKGSRHDDGQRDQVRSRQSRSTAFAPLTARVG